ncbi:MAG: MerR family transcriptional regulator [Clostridia bacterium]|nr:MerR family transcriptional regulator [Clostridia bacterium]
MELRNCSECGKIFNFLRTPLCPECQEKEEECFRVVRKYIAQHPGVSAIDVSKDTGIGEEKVLHFLKEGRLAAGAIKQIKLECELCGGFISGGRYCPSCQEKLTSGLKKVIQEENKKILEKRFNEGSNEETKREGTRMHTAELWRKRNN